MNNVAFDKTRIVIVSLSIALLFVAGSGTVAGGTDAQPLSRNDCSGVLTPRLTEGPYYKTGSPERKSLVEALITGKIITITGYVFDADCRPLQGARIDFWQADGEGAYDNAGYRMRGHQFTDSNGRYMLTTVIPGEYPGRTPHIHVRLDSAKGTTLVTQLFFPGTAANSRDSIFDDSLVVRFPAGGDGRTAIFNFVVTR